MLHTRTSQENFGNYLSLNQFSDSVRTILLRPFQKRAFVERPETCSAYVKEPYHSSEFLAEATFDV